MPSGSVVSPRPAGRRSHCPASPCPCSPRRWPTSPERRTLPHRRRRGAMMVSSARARNPATMIGARAGWSSSCLMPLCLESHYAGGVSDEHSATRGKLLSIFPRPSGARRGPAPVLDLGHVVAVAGDVLLVLDQLVAHRLLGI